jgi:hypothetical protein
MPTLVLDKLWVNLVSSGEGISGASNRGKGWTVEMDLSVRTYASGRRRAIGVAGLKRELPYTLVAVYLPTRTYLEDWIGKTVQVRDNRGQKWYGVFAGLSVGEYMRTDLYTVSFTLLEATTVEGV